jgi:membrane-bound serine protease (ClpP class)
LAGFENKMILLKISGAITPASDDIIVNTITKAENEGVEALVTSRHTWGRVGRNTGNQKKIGDATVHIIG